jgi:hypothetical protein
MTSPKRISTDLAIELVFREAKMKLRDEQAPPGHVLRRDALMLDTMVEWDISRGETIPDFGHEATGHLTYDDTKGEILCKRAFEGDMDADAALSWIAFKYMVFDCPLPKNLKDHVCLTLLRNFHAEPKTNRGRNPHALIARDAWIVVTIAGLAKLGFSPTRNPATIDNDGNPSGSFIIAEALQRLGINISESGVANVWSERDALMPLPDFKKTHPRRRKPRAVRHK